jgi:hypothetical protein
MDDLGLDIVSGICFFEYADEWWKDTAAGQLDVQNFGPRWNFPINDFSGNEEWWGIMRIVDDGNNLDILEPRAAFYRLAAMWNPPYIVSLSSIRDNGQSKVEFTYPLHLRDQPLEVERSTDLNNWTIVADNANSTYLSSNTSDLTVSNTVAGEDVHISISLYPEGDLLINGGFETGDATGWATPGVVGTSPAPEAGSYSLQLTALGGFSVPAAFQTFPASPGEEFNLSGYIYTSSALPADTTFGLFKIVFKDASDADLEPASVSVGQFGPGDNPGAESLPFLNSASPIATWVFSEAQAIAPTGTASVSFFILNVDQSPSTMSFDSVEAVNLSAAPNPERVFLRVRSLTREAPIAASAREVEAVEVLKKDPEPKSISKKAPTTENVRKTESARTRTNSPAGPIEENKIRNFEKRN